MVIRLALLVICFSLHSSTVYGAASTWPAPIPLFHKSPYLNAWIDASSNVSNSPAQRWPKFFNQKVLLNSAILYKPHIICVECRMVHWDSRRWYYLHDTRRWQQCQLHRRRHDCFHVYHAHTDPLHYRGRTCLCQSNIPQSYRGV